MDNIKTLQQLPKIELHFHFEGAFSMPALWILSKKYNPDVSYNTFRKIFSIYNFKSFINAWEYKNSLIKSIDDLSFLCDTVIQYMHSENIIYSDITISPFGFKNLQPENVIELLYNKFSSSKIPFTFIGDIVRNTEISKALKKYALYKEMRNYGIKAIGLGGDEEKYPPLLFRNLFETAKKDNFKISIHAGEYNSETNVINSILYCHADRIGHANNIKNQNLIDLIKNKKIHVELCPLSNKILNSKFSIETYCFLKYWRNNINISINSDDPGLLGKTLSQNYAFILKNYKLTIDELFEIQKNAVSALFCDKTIKNKIKKYLSQTLISDKIL